MNTTIRNLEPEFDNRGNPSWKSRLSAPDNSYGLIKMIPDRVIPVIFVPGVMGSNLQGTGDSKNVQWLLNSESGMAFSWATADEKHRKKHLTPSTMRVLDSGKIAGGTRIPTEELKRRGWGEVGFMSYGAFLSWLENALNDFENAENGERAALRRSVLNAEVGESPITKEEFELSYKYLFPVYACGYNWLDSNTEASKRLGVCISSVIERYRREKKKCEKVILVTHSMGGLVARHCSEVGGYRDKIFGIVHGVMPAIGAAAVYRRFKSGTEGPAGPAEVLGSNAAEMTAVLSTAPGPLQLLPTPEYGNGWLKILDGVKNPSFPQKSDPYSEIYTVSGQWWSMCEDHLINPLNTETNPTKKKARIDTDWLAFKSIIDKDVAPFHIAISKRYNPNTHSFIGLHSDNKAYGTVAWSVSSREIAEIDVLTATPTAAQQINEMRFVRGPNLKLPKRGDTTISLRISEPNEDGDGTVPQRSGLPVKSFSKSFLKVNVGHEPAFNHTKGADNLRACRFTLRAIVKIAQEVQQTILKYD